ncbi:calmodulin-binding protein 60 A isoform X3 [Ricinus communis]|uniref:calmodulin-binding protein 60 A isoform X3 n=1 Tax=Ricinus communis TaxID=3988 RepID=UPI00201A9AEF|nr:calmodulin-binding protein 60 A isoform X3 [Ricinus communis]
MSQKRQPEEAKLRSDGNSPEEKRRRFNLKNVVQEVIKMQSFQHLLEPILEPLIRRVVKEEVELALRKHLANIKRNCGNEKDFIESRSFKLQFSNSLSLPVFTGARIEGEECSSIKVILIDTLTGRFVNTGPECSAKVEIVVLEGDFDGEEGDNWTHDEFKNNIVREREGKKPLLTGDVFLNLNEGIGLVGEIAFTDNSSWTRSRRFRLGARVVDNFDGTNVREAKTESFIVRDHRGELYKKHHPPSLSDEVWRLEKIGKDGAFHKRLSRENITTVKDFLTQLFIDSQRLRHKSGVVFNVVGQVMGLLSDCQYIPVDKISETEKADAQNLVMAAFEHSDEVISFEDEASLVDDPSQLSNILYPSSSLRTDSTGNKLLASHKIGGFDCAQPNASSPDIISSLYSVGGVSSLDDYALHNIENMGLRYDQNLSFLGHVSNPLICDTDTMTQAFCDEDHLRFFDTDLQTPNLSLEAPTDLQSALDGFLLTRSTAVANDKAQRRWTKISSVLKWFSIRKHVASKKTRVSEIHRYT